jgi:hypothetical protein
MGQLMVSRRIEKDAEQAVGGATRHAIAELTERSSAFAGRSPPGGPGIVAAHR